MEENVNIWKIENGNKKNIGLQYNNKRNEIN